MAEAAWRQSGDLWCLDPGPRAGSGGVGSGIAAGVVEFIGGSYLAATPQLSYRRLLESLARRGWSVLAWSYLPGFDHQQQAISSWRAFRDSYADLVALGSQVWGVSGDGADSHRRFAARHNLPFPLLVDSGNRLRQAFGVPSVLGLLPGRVTYVIDGEGVIRRVFNNLLDGPAHRREAILALRQLAAAAPVAPTGGTAGDG
jgi:alkyl hydroperoxide reductase subunit AhpC